MPFTKTAKLPLVSIAAGQYDQDSKLITFKRVASRQEASVYEGSNKFDVKSALDLVAKDYNISDDPNDYIFEAARAVTAEVPNDNGDAFGRGELLRFDHRLAKAVYQTFIFKPHHINHRADDPKTSRGLVLDASYNDRTPPLEDCPGCSAKTASIEARDSSGINCRKCGHAVKDEFVELLIGIDTKKDPTFAKGVKNGALNSLSMGCEAGYTDCSICENRARTVGQFCSHIKSGKKKIFKTASGPKMSYEKCGEVIFTEISRVDQPADPTALQREVFQVMPMMESEMLLMGTRLAKLEAKLSKGAQLMGDDVKAVELSPEEVDQLKTTHPELYMKLQPLVQGGESVPAPMSIDDYAKKHQESLDQEASAAEMGIQPEMGSGLKPTAAAKLANSINDELSALIAGTVVLEDKTVSMPTLKFADSYKDLEVEVTGKGNVKVFTPKGTLFVVRPTEKPTDAASANKIATEVLTHIAEHGLVATATKYRSVINSKIAQVLQHHQEDFAGGREEGDKGGITDGGLGDGQLEARGTPEKSLVKEEHTDRKDEVRDSKSLSKNDALETEEHDHKEKRKPMENHITDGAENDMNKERSKAPKTTQDDVNMDMKDKLPKAAASKQAELPDFLKKKDDKKSDKDEPKAEDKKEAQMSPAVPATGAGPAVAAPTMACMAACDASGCKCPPGCACPADEHCKCACSGKMANWGSKMDVTAAKKHLTRVERIYKARLQKTQAESDAKLAALKKDALAETQAKLVRALKLAAKRQSLNLEESPLKAKMFDVLATARDIDHDSYYPGMDAETATHIIEATAEVAFDDLIDSLVKRASEFLSMNEEALRSIETDIKNLRPANITVQAAVKQSKTAARDEVRTAALNGNLIVAPAPVSEGVSSGNKRDNIRTALDTTKVRRNSQAYLK